MPKNQTPNPGAVCIFSGMVRGRRRHAVIRLTKQWQTLDSAETIVMNEAKAYASFYAGAVDEDYDAEITDRRLQVQRKPKLIQEGEK